MCFQNPPSSGLLHSWLHHTKGLPDPSKEGSQRKQWGSLVSTWPSLSLDDSRLGLRAAGTQILSG